MGAAHIFDPRRRAEMRTFHGVFVYNADDIAKRYKVSESKARKMLYEAKMRASEIICDMLDRSKKPNLEAIKERVRRELSKMLAGETGRNPMIVPFITDL